MKRKRRTDDWGEQLDELDEKSRRRSLAAWVTTRLEEAAAAENSSPPSLREVLSSWPADLARRLVEECREKPARRRETYAAYQDQVTRFFRDGRGRGFEAALTPIAAWGISGAGADYAPPYHAHEVSRIIVGDGRILRPWLLDLLGRADSRGRSLAVYRLSQFPFVDDATVPWLLGLLTDDDARVRFSAAVRLSEFEPGTPGLADVLLGWLTDDDTPERLWYENQYPSWSRKYEPVEGLRPLRQALSKIELSDFGLIPDAEDSLFRHSADFVARRAVNDVGGLDGLIDALWHPERIVRRVAAVGLVFGRRGATLTRPDLVTAILHPDPYVRQMTDLFLLPTPEGGSKTGR